MSANIYNRRREEARRKAGVRCREGRNQVLGAGAEESPANPAHGAGLTSMGKGDRLDMNAGSRCQVSGARGREGRTEH